MNWPPLSNELSSCLQDVITEAVIQKPENGDHGLIKFVMEELQKKSGWGPEQYETHLAKMIEKIPREYILEEVCPEECNPFRWIPMRYNDGQIAKMITEHVDSLCKKVLSDADDLDTVTLWHGIRRAYPEFCYLRDMPTEKEVILLIKALSLGLTHTAITDTQLQEDGGPLEGKEWNEDGYSWLNEIMEELIKHEKDLDCLILCLMRIVVSPYERQITAWPSMDRIKSAEATNKFIQAVKGTRTDIFMRLCRGEASEAEFASIQALHSLNETEYFSAFHAYILLGAVTEVSQGDAHDNVKNFVTVALEKPDKSDAYADGIDQSYPSSFKNFKDAEWKRMARRLMILGRFPSAEKMDSTLGLLGSLSNVPRVMANMKVGFLRCAEFWDSVEGRSDISLVQCLRALDKVFEGWKVAEGIIDFRELSDLAKSSTVLVTPLDELALTLVEDVDGTYVIKIGTSG